MFGFAQPLALSSGPFDVALSLCKAQWVFNRVEWLLQHSAAKSTCHVPRKFKRESWTAPQDRPIQYKHTLDSRRWVLVLMFCHELRANQFKKCSVIYNVHNALHYNALHCAVFIDNVECSTLRQILLCVRFVLVLIMYRWHCLNHIPQLYIRPISGQITKKSNSAKVARGLQWHFLGAPEETGMD